MYSIHVHSQIVKPELTFGEVIAYFYLLLQPKVADSHSWRWDSKEEALHQNN